MTLVLFTLMLLAPSVFIAVEKIFDFCEKLPARIKQLMRRMGQD